MDNAIIYLLKVSACIIVLYIFYRLLFERDTFYARNRYLILGMLLASLVFPLLSISPSLLIKDSGAAIERIGEIVTTGGIVQTDVSEKITRFNYINLLYIIYLAGVILFLANPVAGVVKTLQIIRRGRMADAGFPKVILADEDYPPFSFYPYIVLPESLLNSPGFSEVIKHEKIHIEQRHTFDLLFMQILTALLWFNPFIWMFRRSMILTHEFIADSKVPGDKISLKDYQYSLLNTASGGLSIPVAHKYSNFIKKRIIMMNRKPSKNFAALKNLMLLPLAALLLVLFSFRPAPQTGDDDKKMSSASADSIVKYIATKIKYPQDAKEASVEATIYLSVEVENGVVKECEITKNKKRVDSQILNEIVVIAYAKNPIVNKKGRKNTKSFEDECLRVAKLVTDIQIPEWKEGEVEFTIPIIFHVR
ncbi:M56 family metallopeptidase [Bacteroidota bacterium]